MHVAQKCNYGTPKNPPNYQKGLKWPSVGGGLLTAWAALCSQALSESALTSLDAN